MLTTLSLGGLFDKVAGILFGRCSDCGVKGPSFSLEEILRDRFGALPVPVLSGLSFGHIKQKLVGRSAPEQPWTRMRGWCGWRRVLILEDSFHLLSARRDATFLFLSQRAHTPLSAPCRFLL